MKDEWGSGSIHPSSFIRRLSTFQFSLQNRKRHDYTGRGGEPVSESYIGRRRMSRLKLGVDNAVTSHRDLLDDPAGGIDEGGDAGRAGPQQVAIVLDGTQARLIQVLSGRRGAVVPGIVGNRDEDVRAMTDLSARELRIHDLVADGRTIVLAPDERRVPGAELEFANVVHELLGEEEHLAHRHVFAEWDEPDLVVVAHGPASTDEKGRIPHLARLLRVVRHGAEDDVNTALP